MKRLLFVAALTAAGAMGGTMPASANQTSNAQMPFPALMNAIFGPAPANRASSNRAASNRVARPARQAEPIRVTTNRRAAGATEPVRSYRQPYTSGARRDDAAFLLPGQRLPAYSSRNARTGNARNVAALQSAPRTKKVARGFNPAFAPTVVDYAGSERAGTIIINTNERFLYLVQGDGTAKRYGVGVGRPGFEWRGTHKVTRKAEWPDWRPPAQMRKRQPGLPHHMPGGPNNPLGARALYLGSTLYRIHGSNEPWSIGHAVSSGCIRMRNEDVIDLYERVGVGTTVKVL